MPSTDDLARAAARRLDVLARIRESVRTRGYPPSVSELAEQTAVSKRQTRKDLAALVDAGAIEVDPGVPRGIRVRRRPPTRRTAEPSTEASA